MKIKPQLFIVIFIALIFSIFIINAIISETARYHFISGNSLQEDIGEAAKFF